MTVAVSCNLSDGVILGVDSAVTIPSPSGIVKVYEHAEKLFQLATTPIGIAIFGLGGIRDRSIGSYLREFEILNPSNVVTSPSSVQDVVEEIRNFFMNIYSSIVIPDIENATKKKFDEIPDVDKPILGFVVGGFSNGQFLSEVWQIVIPQNATPHSAVQSRPPGSFGCNWFASCEPITRYIKGYDPALLNEIMQFISQIQNRQLNPQEVTQLKGILFKHEYQIPFSAMPIQEGIAHVKFLIDLVINHFRFSVGAPIVGGKTQIGLVTYKGDHFQILEGG